MAILAESRTSCASSIAIRSRAASSFSLAGGTQVHQSENGELRVGNGERGGNRVLGNGSSVPGKGSASEMG